MKHIESRTFWGIVLIAAGVLFLLQSLGLPILNNLWPLVLSVAGMVFLYRFLTERHNWWAVIPGMALLGLGALITFERLFPKAPDNWGAVIFMGSLSLSFLAVYGRTAARQWWAIIPAGVLGTITLLIGFEPYMGDDVFAGLFLLGIAATFALVYFLPTPAGRMRWAAYPAAIVGGIGFLILISVTWLSRMLAPLAIIVFGVYLILRRHEE
ncbi:MAG TPA: hypothetical protein PLJ78_02830 [Anaerolineae bacterium]|nr:hypothetical protein [Anaerolineae bacterium]HQK12861.1 hypothetical protein [Anaerolineae bacterium]